MTEPSETTPDLSRSAPIRGDRDGRATGKVGGVAPWSVNTWLIVVNIAIFVVGNVLGGTLQRRTAWGTEYTSTSTAEQRGRAVVNSALTLPMPDMPGVMYHPIMDPNTVLVGPDGREARDLRTGGPIFQEVGRQRFTYRPFADSLGHFSTGKAFAELQIWRFITFQFLHQDIVHLLMNMLGLYFFGDIVETYLGRRRYLALYLASGVFGGVGYLILNFAGYVLQMLAPALVDRFQIPALLFHDIYTPLVGASAGVFGVLMAAAFIAPTMIVEVFFVLPMRLRSVVYIFFLISLINLLRGSANAGGEAAHVGGAVAGHYLIRRSHLLRDFFNLMRSPRRIVPSSSSVNTDRVHPVDAALARARESGRDGGVGSGGLHELSQAERDLLRRASEAFREQ